MKKLLFIMSVVIFIFIQSDGFAGGTNIDALPKSELEKYNSLPPQVQAEALRHLQKMGYYDPERTFLDKTGHFFIVDDSLDTLIANGDIELPSNQAPTKKVISDNPPSGYTPEGVPIFHSFPGSPNVIYLNFLGGHITHSAWNDNYGVADYNTEPYIPAAYNPNQTPGFPPAVQNAIAGIWSRVAEDYAPWQVDVTTEAPASFSPTTLEALITKTTTLDGVAMPSNYAGGIAYEDIIGYANYTYYIPALIYYDNLADGNEDAVADAVAHEIGHNFGLSHEGILNGATYYTGAGSGEISWGCIMGAPYFKTVTKFCIGDYPNANNQEDQLSIISGSIPFRNPSAGNSAATATPLVLINSTAKFSGIIENYTSFDVFSLNNVGGTLSVSATTYRAKVDTLGNNLCLALRLFDASGHIITSSSNPNSCSATITANSLPLGNYFIQVYPVGNTITPFSVYGSIGQYDLVATASMGSLSLSPPYTTLALNSTMSFDANDTVSVLNGVPPYTFSATINSISHSGTTYTYVASKPGLDNITVTDSHGNTATARVTVSLMDFGGMYGYSRLGNYNNPVTGTFGCPSGYTSQQIMGSLNVDYPLYYCYRMHANGVPATIDFGGTYSGSGVGLRPNPITGAGTCPSGYTSAQVFGDNTTHNPDYPTTFCYKIHNESVPEAASFAGMYAPAYSTNYNNPVTRAQSCPAGWVGTIMLGTFNVDYPFYLCAYSLASLKITPQFTNMALNNTMSFDANDTVHISGGVPPYSYAAILGTFTHSGTTYIYTASKPGLDSITVTDSKGNTATARMTVGFIDFGGMYGYGANGNFSNPTTGVLGCPSGYRSQQVMGTTGVDYPLYYCYRMHVQGVPADFDFGGIYSNSGSGLRPNPLTGSQSCPSGYTAVKVYGGNSNSPDYPAYLCYKTHSESVAEAAHFGGMYAPAFSTNYNNPATGAQSCPSGWNDAIMLGTLNVDYPFHFCY